MQSLYAINGLLTLGRVGTYFVDALGKTHKYIISQYDGFQQKYGHPQISPVNELHHAILTVHRGVLLKQF